eukprot:Gb_04881 [translate_table: standard]
MNQQEVTEWVENLPLDEDDASIWRNRLREWLEEACLEALPFRVFCWLRSHRGNVRPHELQHQKPRLEIPKFIGSRDGRRAMTWIHKLKQYFRLNPMDDADKTQTTVLHFDEKVILDKNSLLGMKEDTVSLEMVDSKKDDPKGVSCDDGQSILTVSTVAIDPRGINYDNPFVLIGQKIKVELTGLEF